MTDLPCEAIVPVWTEAPARPRVLLHEEPPVLPQAVMAAPHRPSLLADLLAAESTDERRRTVKAMLHAMGFEWLGYGRLAQATERGQPVSFCTTYADPQWARHYFAEAYHEVDPRLHAAVHSNLPCVWTLDELAQRAESAPRGTRLRRFVADLADTGMRGGALLVLPTAQGGERHFVSLLSRTAGSHWMGDGLLGQVLTLGLCLHEFYTRYSELPVARDVVVPSTLTAASLSPLQRDILERVAHGASDKQIAYDLHLSSHAVDYHMRQLRRRFAARNRVQLTQVLLRGETPPA